MLLFKTLQLISCLIVQIAGQISGERSRLLILLESEKQKAAQRIEALKQRRTEVLSPYKRYQSVLETQAGKTDLYKVALLVREANKISQLLKKNMVCLYHVCELNGSKLIRPICVKLLISSVFSSIENYNANSQFC